MKRLNTIFLALFLATILATGQNQGSMAPDFSFKDLSGNDVKLSDLRGKVVFVFTFGYSCTFCRNAAPKIKSDVLNKVGSNPNVITLAIDTWNGSNTQVSSFKNSTGLDMQFLVKGSGIHSNWNTSYDRLFVVDAQGVLVYKGGSDGAINQTGNAYSAISSALNNVAASIKNVSEDYFDVSVYPNPVTSQSVLTFSLEHAGATSVEIYSAAGKKVKSLYEGKLHAGEHLFPLYNELKSGLYLLQIRSEGKRFTQRVLVR